MNAQDLINRARAGRAKQAGGFGTQPTVGAITNQMPQATVPKQYVGYGNDMVMNGQPMGSTLGRTITQIGGMSGLSPQGNMVGPVATPGGYPVPSQQLTDTPLALPVPDTRQGPMPNPGQGGLSNIFANRNNLWSAGGPMRQKVNNQMVGQGGQPVFNGSLGQTYAQTPSQSASGGGSDPYANLNYYDRQGDWVLLGSAADIPGADPNSAYTTQLVWYNPKTGEQSNSPPAPPQPAPGEPYYNIFPMPLPGYTPMPSIPPGTMPMPLPGYTPMPGTPYDNGPVVNGQPPATSLSRAYVL